MTQPIFYKKTNLKNSSSTLMNKLITDRQVSELIAFRKQLHSNPEVSGQEFETAQLVTPALKTYDPDETIDGLGGTGVLARYIHPQEGPTLMFRAELDALPIQEENEFEHKSQRMGVSHKCGHDGHMTILLGLANRLSQSAKVRGRTLLLFQPAEETGEGAQSVLCDSRMHTVEPDLAFALHNLPGYPLGTVVLRKGAFTASVKSLIIKLDGKTSHAAEPEHGVNPALAIAEIMQSVLSYNEPDIASEQFAIITPVHIRMGEIAYGVSAGHGEIHLTIRTFSPEVMKQLSNRILDLVKDKAEEHQLKLTTSWTNEFKANFNDDQAIQLIEKAAEQLGLAVTYRDHPLNWGEDFGAFTQSFSGAMFGLGSGMNHPALHNPDFDFPDALIEIGVNIFHTIARLASKNWTKQ